MMSCRTIELLQVHWHKIGNTMHSNVNVFFTFIRKIIVRVTNWNTFEDLVLLNFEFCYSQYFGLQMKKILIQSLVALGF